MALRMDQRRWLVLAVICIAQLMAVLDVAVTNIALPSAQSALCRSSRGGRRWRSPMTAVVHDGN